MSYASKTTSAEETIAFAPTFAGNLRRGDVVAPYGDLEAEKHSLLKECARHLKCTHLRPVLHLSFLIDMMVQTKTEMKILMYHFDLYRVKSGFLRRCTILVYEEFLKSDGICLIEWAEMLGGNCFQSKGMTVRFFLGTEENERQIDNCRSCKNNDNPGY